MITASIYRTDPSQIRTQGAMAWENMNFRASHVSAESVRDYCHTLATRDGIINPRIEISVQPQGEPAC